MINTITVSLQEISELCSLPMSHHPHLFDAYQCYFYEHILQAEASIRLDFRHIFWPKRRRLIEGRKQTGERREGYGQTHSRSIGQRLCLLKATEDEREE